MAKIWSEDFGSRDSVDHGLAGKTIRAATSLPDAILAQQPEF